MALVEFIYNSYVYVYLDELVLVLSVKCDELVLVLIQQSTS